MLVMFVRINVNYYLCTVRIVVPLYMCYMLSCLMFLFVVLYQRVLSMELQPINTLQTNLCIYPCLYMVSIQSSMYIVVSGAESIKVFMFCDYTANS